jgi:hypothetical protein
MVLFFSSLGLIAIGFTGVMNPGLRQIAWVLALGGAVVVRLKRQALVNKYNAALTGGPAPLQ